MGETSECIWSSFLLGVLLCGIKLLISVPRKMHTLVLMSALAPVLVPVCISGVLLVHYIGSLCANRVQDGRYTNTNHDATASVVPVAVATVELTTLRPELREQPSTSTEAHSSRIASLLTVLYDKEAVKGGPECPICQQLYEKNDVIVRLPCIHPFYKDCIKKWFRIKESCPVCISRVDMEIRRDIALIID